MPSTRLHGGEFRNLTDKLPAAAHGTTESDFGESAGIDTVDSKAEHGEPEEDPITTVRDRVTM